MLYRIFAVIPTLDNIISLDAASQTSLTVRFETSSPDDINADTPVVFEIRQRLNGTMTWVLSLELPHSGSVEYITMLEDLEPNTPYYVNIVPVIIENGIRYPGHAKEAGPFKTLEYGKQPAIVALCTNWYLFWDNHIPCCIAYTSKCIRVTTENTFRRTH